jgi:hypothetical protein
MPNVSATILKKADLSSQRARNNWVAEEGIRQWDYFSFNGSTTVPVTPRGASDARPALAGYGTTQKEHLGPTPGNVYSFIPGRLMRYPRTKQISLRVGHQTCNSGSSVNHDKPNRKYASIRACMKSITTCGAAPESTADLTQAHDPSRKRVLY